MSSRCRCGRCTATSRRSRGRHPGVRDARAASGGFQLLDGYRTKLTGLTGDEADALFLAGLPGAAADLGLGSVLAATQLKLLAALPPDLRGRAARIRDRFHLDAPGLAARRPTRPPFLATIADAVWAQHRRRGPLRACRTGPSSTGVLEPLGLVLKAGTWYLVARSPATAAGRAPTGCPASSAAAGLRRDVRAAGRVRPRGALGRLPARVRAAALPRLGARSGSRRGAAGCCS